MTQLDDDANRLERARDALERGLDQHDRRIGPNGHDALAAVLGAVEDDPAKHQMDWALLSQSDAPEREWIIPHWLSWHPTLLAGRGGIGKTLIAQQIGTALSTGHAFLGVAHDPVRVLMWACEDDHDELWRRQERICTSMGLPIGGIGNFHLDARYGLQNALFGESYGQPTWTAAIAMLEKRIEQTQCDVLILDNIGHLYGANENNRHMVTTFTSAMAGLVRNRKFCVILLGHPAKAIGSEYSGSTAWETSVRMRWFLSDKLPDQDDDENREPDPNVRFLAKRKTNYTSLDYVRLNFEEGVLVPERNMPTGDSALLAGLIVQRASSCCLLAISRLASMGKTSSDAKGANYLPSQMIEMGMAEGLSKMELKRGLNRLLMDGQVKKDVVGKYAKGAVKYGLVISQDIPQNTPKT